MLLKKVLDNVFEYKKGEKVSLTYDLLKTATKDYIFRKNLAKRWYLKLKKQGVPCELVSYFATGKNNSDLPNRCISNTIRKSFHEVLSTTNIVIALNTFSATAPLKKFAKQFGFRAASMPGFCEDMIPAIELDFNRVRKKVDEAYELLRKENFAIDFEVDGEIVSLNFDLRKREPIKDNALCNKPGQVINLPSGEAFIAPYDAKDSITSGILPIQTGNTINFYTVKKNRIISARIDDELINRIRTDTAIGNIAELAFGVLSEFGIKPCGKVLLDEKLGLHIALGRNDHFGGLTGPDKFKDKKNVWHQDYVYIKECQPRIKIKKIRTF